MASPIRPKKTFSLLAKMFEPIKHKLTVESQSLKSVDHFFKDSQKFLDHITKYLTSIKLFYKSIPEASFSLKQNIGAITNEIDELVKDIINARDLILQDIQEPLKAFRDHFDLNFNNCVKQGAMILESLTEARKATEKSKKVYLLNAEKLEKAQDGLKTLMDSNEQSEQHSQAIKVKTEYLREKKDKMYSTMEEYRQSLDLYNKMVDDKLKEYGTLAEIMLQLDENRIEQVKTVLKKHTQWLELIAKCFINRTASFELAIDSIDPRYDTDSFITENESHNLNTLFFPLRYEKYLYKNPAIESFETFPGNSSPLRIDFDNGIAILTASGTVSLEQKTRLIEHLHKSEGREIFGEILANITQPLYISSINALKELGELINYMLNIYMMNKLSNYEILLVVINASRNIYTKVNGKVQFLYLVVSRNSIWKDINLWKELINFSINQSTEDMQSDRESTPKSKTKKGLMIKFRSALNKMFVKEDTKTREKDWGNKKVMSSVAFNVLVQYAIFLANYHVSILNAKHLVLYYGKKYEVEPSKIKEVELDLMTLQHLPKIKKESKGNSKVNAIKKAIPYIKDKNLLRNILLINKETYNKVKAKVYRQVLNTFNVTLDVRKEIWEQLFNVRNCNVDYEAFIDLLKEGVLSKQIEDVINLDVQRSFVGHKYVNPTSVKNILRAYALYNKDVEYCQGMNFIVGFLLFIFKDESLTFKVLLLTIQKFNMEGVLSKDIPLVRKFFFQLDRLYFLHYPELTKYLKSEGISSNFYASTWFITLFTNTFLYSKSSTPPETLFTIWDNFLTNGWKAIFKVGLFILHQLHDKLFDMKFDGIMTSLTKCQILIEETVNVKLKEMMQKLKISRKLLDAIGKEYDDTLAEVKTVMKSGTSLEWDPPEMESYD